MKAPRRRHPFLDLITALFIMGLWLQAAMPLWAPPLLEQYYSYRYEPELGSAMQSVRRAD